MRATLLREPLDVDVAPARRRADPARRGAAVRADRRVGGRRRAARLRPVRVAAPGDDLFALLDDVPGVRPPLADRRPRPPRRPHRGPLPRRPLPGAGPSAAAGSGSSASSSATASSPATRRRRGRSPLPDGALAYYDHVLRMRRRRALVVRGARDARSARRRSRRGRDELVARLARPPAPRPFATRDWRWMPSPAGHARAVEACRERIAAGDLFQANLCLRLEGRLEGDALDLFADRRGRAADRPRRVRRRAVGDGREPLAGALPRARTAAPCGARRSRARARRTGATSSRPRRRTAPRT